MPSRKIEDCVVKLQLAWLELQRRFSDKFPGWKLSLTCTHRTQDEQRALYAKGRKIEDSQWVTTDPALQVTWTLSSKHTKYPAEAFDFVVVNSEGKTVWDYTDATWAAIPSLVEGLGVTSGATWKTKKDFPHIEI